MRRSTHATDHQNRFPISLVSGDRARRGAGGRRRFDRGVGAWLGGITLGTGGFLFGASMPYQHPVGVAVSALWWGVYFGCLGLSLGAVLGVWVEPSPALPPQAEDGAGSPSPGR